MSADWHVERRDGKLYIVYHDSATELTLFGLTLGERIEQQQAEIQRLAKERDDREAAANWLYMQLCSCENEAQLRIAVHEAERRWDWITGG